MSFSVECVELHSVIKVKNMSTSVISIMFSTPELSLYFPAPLWEFAVCHGNQFGMGHRHTNQWELEDKFELSQQKWYFGHFYTEIFELSWLILEGKKHLNAKSNQSKNLKLESNWRKHRRNHFPTTVFVQNTFLLVIIINDNRFTERLVNVTE